MKRLMLLAVLALLLLAGCAAKNTATQTGNAPVLLLDQSFLLLR